MNSSVYHNEKQNSMTQRLFELKRRCFFFISPRLITIQIVIFVLYLFLLLCSTVYYRPTLTNMFPFPDSFHYVVPAKRLAQGKSLFICRQNSDQQKCITPLVPPLYSVYLSFFFLFSSRPEIIILANAVVSAIAYWIFAWITQQLFQKKQHARSIQAVLLLLYISNPILLLFVSFPMAEHLLVTLFLLMFALLLSRGKTRRQILLFGPIAVSLFFTKYAAIPLTLTGVFLYGCVLIKQEKKRSVSKLFILLSSVLMCFLGMLWFEYRVYHKEPWGVVPHVLQAYMPGLRREISGEARSRGPHFYSHAFFLINIPGYSRILQGSHAPLLLDAQFKLFPKWLALCCWLGLLYLSKKQKDFLLARICTLVLVFSQVMFISTFYVKDLRYIIFAIPLMVIGFGMFLSTIFEILDKKKRTRISQVVILILLAYAIFQFSFLCRQPLIHNRNKKTLFQPVISTFDRLVRERHADVGKTILISPMIPYLFDLFAQEHVKYLPSTSTIIFFSQAEDIWDTDDVSTPHNAYAPYSRQDYLWYYTDCGITQQNPPDKWTQYVRDSFDVIETVPVDGMNCAIEELVEKKKEH